MYLDRPGPGSGLVLVLRSCLGRRRPSAAGWPRSGRSRLREPAGVKAATGGHRAPAVPPAGGGEQRTAILGSIQVGSRSVTVATTHLSNRQGHNVRQLRELRQVAGSRAAPRLLVGDLTMPSTVLLFASRRGWPETGRGRTFPNSAPTQQLDHILRIDPAGAVRPAGQGGRRARQRPSRPGGGRYPLVCCMLGSAGGPEAPG